MKATLVALNAHYMHTNLALRQIIKAMPPTEWAVEMVEGHINLPFWDLFTKVMRTNPDVLGISCYIWNIDMALKLARAARRAKPNLKIFVGGPEVSYRAESVLDSQNEVDWVLTGEGEKSFPMLLEAAQGVRAPGDVPGLCWRDGEKAVCNAQLPPLPPEEWPDVYEDGIAGLENRLLYIETSRGCPYKCQYCLSSAQGGVRALDAQESIRRLTFLAERGAKIIKLVDRTFNFDVGRAQAIWQGLIDHAMATGVRPTYHFEIGAHLIGRQSLEILARAPRGLFQFEIGVQTSSERVLSTISRAPSFEKVRQATLALRALDNIHLHVDLIAGLPGEGVESFAQSIDDVCEMRPHKVQLGFLKLLHGSRLRADAQAHHLIYQPDAPYEIIRSDRMSFEELCHLKDVETVMEWFLNSERYPGCIRLLREKMGWYELFDALARTFRGKDILEREQSEKGRAEALLDFMEMRVEPPWARAMLSHDLLSAGRRRDLPERLAFEEDGELRAMLRARYHPVRGQSARRYSVDVLHYLHTGEKRAEECVMIYEARAK